jgi:heat-inducible transcriptional repressor
MRETAASLAAALRESGIGRREKSESPLFSRFPSPDSRGPPEAPKKTAPATWAAKACLSRPQALSMPQLLTIVPNVHDNLDIRARRLLRALIAQYIRDGVPVGSRTLSKNSGLDVSPATIRNVMADLEELGLVTTPHTSAGRVPTAQGYRLFVDSLLQMQPLQQQEMENLGHRLSPQLGTQDLLTNSTELLSAMTHFVGVVTVPKREQFAFRHIDFVPLDPNRVLVILVFTDHEVQNRIVNTKRPYTPSELEQTANYLNTHFAGRALGEIRSQLVRELRETRSAMDSILSVAVDMAETAFAPPAEKDVLMAGQTRLMGVQDLSDVDRLRELFEAFARKREILQLLEGCIHAQGVRLFIGEESGMAPLGQCSVVTAPYGAEGRVLGVIGVIGPTRMAYERVIPMVQATAQALGAALNRATPAQ